MTAHLITSIRLELKYHGPDRDLAVARSLAQAGLKSLHGRWEIVDFVPATRG
jgi:hypothetical protein